MLMNLSPILSRSVDEESDFGGIRCSAVDTRPHIHGDGQHFVDSLDVSSWRYRILEELGDGTCGTVYKAIDCITNEIVAVKKMKRKFYFWEEYWRLREIKVLRRLNHPNVIKLKEVVKENDEVFLIFEYMNCNLYEIMRDCQRPFSEGEIRNFMSQVLHGLNHLHRSGYFHRDLKPENLLVTSDVLKIADFGLAREVSSMPPYTEYVSTRWYRAPEVLLQSKSYTPAVDMWAAGAILAELFTLTPIFPGESEIDQLFKICCVLGTPDLTFFPEGTNISRLYDIVPYEKILPANLSDIVPNASPEAIDLMMKLFSWDPSKRPTADEALQHPFFNVAWIPHSLRDPLELKLSNRETEPNLELKLSDFGAEHEDCFLGLTLAVKPSAPSLDLFRDASQSRNKDSLFYSALEDQREQSVLWSLISPDRNSLCAPVESSSFSLSFSSIQHPSMRGSQSAGFSIPGLQPNILDGPFLGMSSPFPRRSLPLSDRLQ